ncbi:uncharacterized protein syt18b [Pygocentrus nattereri]|uniref:uncharacterized protein syt18b n=1 Tax=Pygocentrus nattereri TaxID=42514 RepID=UPI00081461A1|nr:uncharacterized protein syt18b [Pygocentrus nattereri]
MSSEDDDHSGQPVWHSVLIFCCKGMIEGIIVVLFMWLLIQVLFTKHLEVHLQILLGVGLMMFCLSLILGCVLCWRRTRQKCPEDKEHSASPPPPPAADHVTLAISPSLSTEAMSTKMQYEELEGDVLDYPSAFGSSTPSDDDFTAISFASRPHATSEFNEQPKSCFPLRRLSSPTLSSPLYRPVTSGRSSLPSFPKLGLLSKTQKVLKRHCTVSGDTRPNSESIQLTMPSPVSLCALSGQLVEKPLLPNYGLNLSYKDPDPCLHFTLTFSPAQRTLTITLLSLTGTVHRLGELLVQASLAPLWPGLLQMSDQHHSLSSDLHRKNLVFEVSTLEALQSCTLRLIMFTQEVTGTKASILGSLEIQCGRVDWISDRPITCTRALR